MALFTAVKNSPSLENFALLLCPQPLNLNYLSILLSLNAMQIEHKYKKQNRVPTKAVKLKIQMKHVMHDLNST